MSPNGGNGGGSRVSPNEYSCAHEAQINFGDLTAYLTYAVISLLLTNTVSPEDACLSISLERFRGSQKEDGRRPLVNQSSLTLAKDRRGVQDRSYLHSLFIITNYSTVVYVLQINKLLLHPNIPLQLPSADTQTQSYETRKMSRPV